MLNFGVIVCTYNRSHLLEKCFTSWCESNYQPDQFIVVDATPNADQYAPQIIEKFPKLFAHSGSCYILTDQPGLTRQRNLGLKNLNTSIVCFADDDLFVTSTYVPRILEVFEQDSKEVIGGVNGVSIGQFDNWQQKTIRLVKNFFRHNLGLFAQRIHIPKAHTKLFEPLPSGLKHLPLIHIDRLWGANMNYRTELIRDVGCDENFQRYGLFEDVDLSVRVGKTHKLVCRLDALINHDESLGQSTRPKDAQYFLASWVNAAYIIEKLFPCDESRNAYQRFFNLVRLFSATSPPKLREQKLRTLGNSELFDIAQEFVCELRYCQSSEELGFKFQQLQHRISSLTTLQV